MTEQTIWRDRPDALYSSTLWRARAVAEALSRVWGLQPTWVDFVREIDCGMVEGMDLAELRERHPQLWARHQDHQVLEHEGWQPKSRHGEHDHNRQQRRRGISKRR